MVVDGNKQLRQSRCFGVFEQKLCWRLSTRGLILLLLAGFVGGGVVLTTVYPFLAISAPVANSSVLVVEGWISIDAIRQAASEAVRRPYAVIYTTGGPVKGTGPYSNDFNTAASVGYGRLIQEGVPQSKLQKVPCRVRDRDRTYSAALALRSWCDTNNVTLESINLFTESVHARRSRLLFQKALGDGVQVGVIAAVPSEYPPNRWWLYSEGVKEIISEAAGYVYARFFFWPR